MNLKFAAAFFVWKGAEKESRQYQRAAIYIHFT